MPTKINTSINDFLNLLPKRLPNSHKGENGRVAIVGGSRGMSGAPFMSAYAAMRSGAGLSWVICPKSIENIITKFSPIIMSIGVHEDEEGLINENYDSIISKISNADASAIGPGLKQSRSLAQFCLDFLTHYKKPLVIDADALNNIGTQISNFENKSNCVLTPHPGELERLVGTSFANFTNREAQIEQANSLSQKTGMTVVLKGHHTFVCGSGKSFLNTTGNSGMATAGSGDVLTGIISTFLAQKIPTFEAAVLGVYLHGLAGDFAENSKSKAGMIATDIIEFLPYAFKSLNLNL